MLVAYWYLRRSHTSHTVGNYGQGIKLRLVQLPVAVSRTTSEHTSDILIAIYYDIYKNKTSKSNMVWTLSFLSATLCSKHGGHIQVSMLQFFGSLILLWAVSSHFWLAMGKPFRGFHCCTLFHDQRGQGFLCHNILSLLSWKLNNHVKKRTWWDLQMAFQL